MIDKLPSNLTRLNSFRYTALKDRKNRIARSRSSHNFGNPDEDEEDDMNSPTAYLQSKYGQTTGNDLSRSRSTHHLKSRENSPDRPGPGSEKDGAALSSWARYLKVSPMPKKKIVYIFPFCEKLNRPR